MTTATRTLDMALFAEQGYLMVPGLLDKALDIQPVVDEYTETLDRLAATWYAEGKISSPYRGLPFSRRFTKILAEGQPLFQHFDISFPNGGVTDDTPIHLGRAVFNLLRSPRLLDAVEQFIGPEIYCNPVQHTRIKPPEREVPDAMRNGLTAAVGWHQDMGVVSEEADNSDILSVWVAITEATVEKSCMVMVPGSHRGELALHCWTAATASHGGHKQVGIPERLLPGQPVPVPMQPGDALFFFKKMMHSSLPNTGDDIRWSFDLRYNPTGQNTGREWFPGFVARSRARPASELRDHAAWAQAWLDTRARLASKGRLEHYRWKEGDPRCA